MEAAAQLFENFNLHLNFNSLRAELVAWALGKLKLELKLRLKFLSRSGLKAAPEHICARFGLRNEDTLR